MEFSNAKFSVNQSGKPSHAVYSSLDRLFSQSIALNSNRPQNPFDSSFTHVDEFASTTDPLQVLSNLMITLKDHGIPGPRLLRLRREFATVLGQGAQFDVFGVADEIVEHIENSDIVELNSMVTDYLNIAIKQSRAATSQHNNPFMVHRQILPVREEISFVSQIVSAHREIDTLCRPSFRNHKNIVKLLGWGLCLDALEESEEVSPRIPLLILERARFDLREFLDKPLLYHPEISYDDCRKICLDVGHGLGALHSEFIVHGDLKPENILLFEDRGGWVAKLCDFGMSSMDHEAKSEVVYHGTTGWRAPEVLTQDTYPLTSGAMKLCDIFAYGLVVWSIFRRGGKPPLTWDQEEEGNAYKLATEQITKFPTIPKKEHRRIILTVQGALHRNPQDRKLQPWNYMDLTQYRHVGKRSKFLNLTQRRLVELDRWLKHALLVQSLRTCLTLSNSSWSYIYHRAYSQANGLFWRALPLEKRRKTKRQNSYKQTAKIYPELVPSPEQFNSPRPVTTHGQHVCSDYKNFYAHFLSAVQSKDNHLVYALARLRSGIRLCCWQAIQPSLSNILSQCMLDCYPLETLAWLSQGEIGIHEIKTGGDQLWNPICTVSQSLSYNSLRSKEQRIYNLEERFDRLQLLLEFGGRIEEKATDSGKRRFLAFLRTLQQFRKRGWYNYRLPEICLTFAEIAKKSTTTAQTRFYLTGEISATMDQVDDLETTALHDCVRETQYLAAEALLGTGFCVDALDSRNRTAMQLALDLSSREVRHENGERFRIVTLLQRNSMNSLQLASWFSNESSSDLPLGWERRVGAVFDDGSKFRIYYDSFTRSTTFIRPSFSLYTDKRLALGLKKYIGNEKTYYLDLMRFITPVERQTNNLIQAELFITKKWLVDEWWRPWPEDGIHVK